VGAVPAQAPPRAPPAASAIDVAFAPQLAAAGAPPAAPGAAACTDARPPGTNLSCAEQAAQGKCNADWMLGGGHCAASCGRPPCPAVRLQVPLPPAAAGCTDVPPGGRFSCAQQKAFGKCTAVWLVQGGYCARTCGRPPCPALAG
jgi:hypothetical protein